MSKTIATVFAFLLLVLGAFLWVGSTITDMTGGERRTIAVGQVETSPEGGETVFWGKGRCFTCHSVGDRGSAVRGPNLGQFGERFIQPIGVRATERAKERTAKTGVKYTTTDYLVECMGAPGAYVVEGYKNEMAIVYAPPISLNLNEIKAVVAYLQSQGGAFDLDAINNPTEVAKKFYSRIEAASAAGGGDPEHGAEVFDDNCSECHRLKGEGGGVGPDLSAIGTKSLRFLSESITKPAKKIAAGFETYEAVAKDGRKTVGIKTRDEATEIDITKANGEVVTIAKGDIKEVTKVEDRSIMPEDLTEALTVKDFQDVLSFLIMQKGGKSQSRDAKR